MSFSKIYKPKKFDLYTVVPSYIFRQKGISAGATGLYCWLFSHEADFNITMQYMAGHFKDGKDALLARVKELEKAGFLVREKIQKAGQFTAYNYRLISEPVTEKPQRKIRSGKPVTENPPQSNIKSLNNSNSNINKVYNNIIYKCFENVVLLFDEKLRPKTQSQKNKWLDTIDKLERIEGYNPRQVYYITSQVLKDDFWKNNFNSILKLRFKNKEGVKYIDVFANRFGKNMVV